VKQADVATARHIYVSPHLDDAVLSCGGLIASTEGRQRTEVWTLFCGAPWVGRPSPLAQWLHSASGARTALALSRRRRREDHAACSSLGCRARHFGWRDAVYRRASTGEWLYSETTEHAPPHDEAALVTAIVTKLKQNLNPNDLLIAPLGIGGHVDHLIARQAVERTGHKPLLYYGDLPYSHRSPEELARRGDALRVFSYPLQPAAVRAWKRAARLYRSQQPMLEEAFGPIEHIIDRFAEAPLCLYGREDSDAAARHLALSFEDHCG